MGVLITGVSSGLGKSLMERYEIDEVRDVYGLDRTYIDLITLYDTSTKRVLIDY